jgi:hypothetical protein
MKYIIRKSQKGKFYFRDEQGEIVMVNEAIANIWEDIDEVVIGSYEVTQDSEGNQLDTPRQQKEVVSYTSEIKDLTKKKKLENLKLDVDSEIEIRKIELKQKMEELLKLMKK